MFDTLLNPEDKSSVVIFPDLLLALTEKSPDFLGKIYENPLVSSFTILHAHAVGRSVKLWRNL
jgi:hypothetical protein